MRARAPERTEATVARDDFQLLLQQLDEDVLAMGSMVDKALSRAMDALVGAHSPLALQVIADDTEIDRKRTEVETACLHVLATQQPLASDLRLIAAILTIATDLERMGDHAEGIAHLTVRLRAEHPVKPPPALPAMAARVRVLLREALDAFTQRDTAAAARILKADDEIDRMDQETRRALLTLMTEDTRTITGATYLLWVAHNIERIGDRIGTIAERTLFVVTGAAHTRRPPRSPAPAVRLPAAGSAEETNEQGGP